MDLGYTHGYFCVILSSHFPAGGLLFLSGLFLPVHGVPEFGLH